MSKYHYIDIKQYLLITLPQFVTSKDYLIYNLKIFEVFKKIS